VQYKKESEDVVTSKRITTMSNNQPKIAEKEVKTKSESKSMTPPPTLNKMVKHSQFKRSTEGKKSLISVDVSKFVKEGRGAIEERYIIDSVIGKGAYGEVSLIHDKITKDKRAMKTINRNACDRDNSTSILTEINLLRSLDHPNILKIHEFYQDKQNYYLITEHCSGGELYNRIITMKNFSESKAAELMKQILSAVTYCHKKNIVHR
jgi:calcium-dependent protein kinase